MSTAFVTGTSTGIGQVIALALARAGYDLAITELDIDALAETLHHPDLKNSKVVPLPLDLRSQDSIAAAFDAAVQKLGAIDLLVNNAGRALIKPAGDVTRTEWDDVIDTNLRGTFFLTQRFGRHCIETRRGGAVVTIASTHGMTGIAGRAVYGIAKAGLIQMTRLHRLVDLVRRGIRLCEPCDHLQSLTAQGVKDGLCHRGGLRAEILQGGVLHTGDVIRPGDDKGGAVQAS